jgi:hypothetical protein
MSQRRSSWKFPESIHTFRAGSKSPARHGCPQAHLRCGASEGLRSELTSESPGESCGGHDVWEYGVTNEGVGEVKSEVGR